MKLRQAEAFGGYMGLKPQDDGSTQHTFTVPPPPCISYALVQATAGVGTVLIWYLI